MNDLSDLDYAAIALIIFAIMIWLTETLHLAIISLIILFIQPLIAVASFQDVIIGFKKQIIFLTISSFITAESIHKNGFIRRLKTKILNKFGTNPDRSALVSYNIQYKKVITWKRL